MMNFETQMIVDETKGLLKGLENLVRTTEFRLAFDTLKDLNKELNDMRLVIDRIETKVTEHIESEEKGEDNKGDELL